MAPVHASIVTGHGGHRILLDADGRTIETPPIEHLAFYAGIGILVSVNVLELPVALLLMVGHILLDVTGRPGLEQLGEAFVEA
jgi:hypothetical protein